MNAGVSMTPCTVVSLPSLAPVSRSVWSTEKSTVSPCVLHLIRSGNADYAKPVLDDLLHAPHQGQARRRPFGGKGFANCAFLGRHSRGRGREHFRIGGRGEDPMLVVKRV